MNPRLVPFAFAKANRVLPAAEREGRLVLWVTASTPPVAIGEVRRALGREVEPQIVPQEEFDAALRAAYSDPHSQAASIVDEVQDAADLGRLMQDLPEVEDLLEARHDAPIIRMLNALLSQAVNEGASELLHRLVVVARQPGEWKGSERLVIHVEKMIGRLFLPANVAPQVGIDRALDNEGTACDEQRLQLRRQELDHPIGDQLVRIEAPCQRGRWERQHDDQRDDDAHKDKSGTAKAVPYE